MRVGLAAGHTRVSDNPDRLEEHNQCFKVEVLVGDLLRAAAVEVFGLATMAPHLYDLENDDSLTKRVALFNKQALDLLVELHLNRGGGDYSCVLHHEHSTVGPQAAQEITHGLVRSYPWGTRGAVSQVAMGRSNLAMLSKTKAPAVLVEPGFQDNPAHRRYLIGSAPAVLYAQAVVEGILYWADAFTE